ncbi:MAG: DNA replication/repair protein RecF [Alkaliphilus sp.]|nr:DNA replication/repair protein RecF [Alkaliphilus sp.]
MNIEKLKIINYRNYNQLQLEFHPKINIFVGDNAQGKTNILEAIYMSGTGKSFRTNRDRDIIKFDKNQAYVKVEAQKRYSNVTVELKLEENKKKQIKINGLSLTKNYEILNNIFVVVFSPEDLKLIKEGPSERRKFLDFEISNIKPSYYHNINQYNKVLMQRNHLLRKANNLNKYKNTLEVWDEKLVEIGTLIIKERVKFINRIGTLSRLIHRKITDNLENLEVKYLSNVPFERENDIVDKFNINLKKNFEIDLNRGMTTVGPHRDDLGIYINGIDARNYGSQGQQRTTALSLKLAEIELIKAEALEYPVLLLDDVMSELDQSRQKYLIKSLKDVQIFITTTEINSLERYAIENKKIFIVNKANVSELVENSQLNDLK